MHALCQPVLGSLPAELGVLVPVERDCLSASLSGRDLLPVLRSSWMARVVAHCVVLSALDEHWMVRGYLLCVVLVFWRARGVFPAANASKRHMCSVRGGGVPVEGMNGSRAGVVVFRELIKGLLTC